MEQLEHILICMDLSEMDDILIRYGNFLVEKFKPRSVTFLHVIKSYEIPPEMIAAFPHLDQPLSEIVREELQEKIDIHFTEKEATQTIVEVAEGSTTDNIVKYARERNIPFALMGKKIGYEGQGGIVRKVIGIIPSSVLLISETTQAQLDHVLVRMDFSRMSLLALKLALKLQEISNAKISCHHVYKLPIKYFPQTTPGEDQKLMGHVEKYSRIEYMKFMKKHGLSPDNISFSTSLDPESDEAHILYTKALSIGADAIFIGSKIKSQLADIIIDNTSEKLASTEKNLPVLIVKDRKQTIGFLKSLFE